MRIEYTCEDGSRTIALWPSLALLYWLGRSHPPPLIENPEPLKLYIFESHLPSDDSDLFLTLVYGEIERRWNKALPFEIVPPNRKNKHGGKKYQACCLEILQWLHAEGDITKLNISAKS